MENLLAWLAQWIAAFLAQMGGAIAAVISQMATWLSQLVQGIATFFSNIFQQFVTILQTIVARVVDVLAAWIQQIQTVVTNIIERLVTLVQLALDRIVALVLAVWESLQDFIESVANRVHELIDGVLDRIGELLDAALEALGEAVGAVVEAIEEAIGALVTTAERLLAEARGRIEQGWEQLITGADAIILSVNQRIGDLATAFNTAVLDLLEGLTGIAAETLGPIVEPFQAIISDLLQWASPPETTALLAQIQKITNGQAAFSDLRDFASWGWRALAPQRGVWKGIFTTIMVAAAAIPLVMQVANASATVAMQEFGKELPYNLLSPGDASAAYRRGMIDEGAAVDLIRRQGYGINDAAIMLRLSEQIPDLDLLLTLVNRGDVSDGDAVVGLQSRGFGEPWIGGLLRLKDAIPPVQDLITMAVREAFSPDIAQQFGQYEDFPAAIVPWLRKQGIDEEWARRYWAAHWGLPSATQGFEMLHRGLVNEDQLRLLLRAQDVMPFWRDKLIQLSYNVLTRVDARRMHQLGVLSDDELLDTHKRMGYSPADAANLTEFVKRLNAHAPGDDDEELGRLSRAQVLGFYRDGALTRERAAQLLIGLGHTPEAAELLLSDVDLDEERAERHATRDLILEQAEAGVLSFEDAHDALARLGLEATEIERALTKLLRSQQRRTKLPSREDGEKFVRARLMPMQDYRELLARLGYASRWVDLYATLLEGSMRNA